MCSVFIKYFKVWIINMYKKENNVSAVVLFFNELYGLRIICEFGIENKVKFL